MKITFSKYHALKNDFLVIDQQINRLSDERLRKLAVEICNRRSAVGADGIIYLSNSKKCDRKFDIYNSDGSWAEKSGNGLRIAGLHQFLNSGGKRSFVIETGSGSDKVKLIKKENDAYQMMTELGKADFDTANIPVKSKQKFMINAKLELSGHNFPVTCLSVGNPHTVLLVDDFNFDWQAIGEEIENHKLFPNRTNVEFVKLSSKKKIIVADWERGAGATGSSGTGAAAAVSACIMLGLVNRECEVVFENGSLFVKVTEDGIIELTGPVEKISEGSYQFK